METVNQMIIKTYSELIKFKTFQERYQYLKLNGVVCEDTFGHDRYLNQKFYKTPEWLRLRDFIIIRDNGCDLAFKDFEIMSNIYIHHLNPININDIKLKTDYLLNPEFLICTSFTTHNAIHYGDNDLLFTPLIERSKNDTRLWQR